MPITLKGRHTIRRDTPSGREPRYVEPCTFDTKPNTALAKLEKSYFAALEAVDALEARKAAALSGGTLTAQGVQSDV